MLGTIGASDLHLNQPGPRSSRGYSPSRAALDHGIDTIHNNDSSSRQILPCNRIGDIIAGRPNVTAQQPSRTYRMFNRVNPQIGRLLIDRDGPRDRRLANTRETTENNQHLTHTFERGHYISSSPWTPQEARWYARRVALRLRARCTVDGRPASCATRLHRNQAFQCGPDSEAAELEFSLPLQPDLLPGSMDCRK
jgi:hypothetical protein